MSFPTAWEITALRRSLLHHLYGSEAYDFEKRLIAKGRKLGVQISYRRAAIRAYGLRHEDQRITSLWSVATGTWEPRSHLTAAHIVPASFGKTLLRRVFGEKYHHPDLWSPRNALLLPKGLAKALDDWAVTIVPDPELPGGGSDPAGFRFRVLDPEHDGLQLPVSSSGSGGSGSSTSSGSTSGNQLGEGELRPVPGPARGRDLDGEPLRFRARSPARPGLEYLYFWHRCAVLSQCWYQFDLSDIVWSQKRSKQEQAALQAWRGPAVAGMGRRGQFWDTLLRELKVLCGSDPAAAAAATLDWSMPEGLGAVFGDRLSPPPIEPEADGEARSQPADEPTAADIERLHRHEREYAGAALGSLPQQ